MADVARVLLLAIYGDSVTDKSSLSQLPDSLPAFAHALTDAAGKTSEGFGSTPEEAKEIDSWLEKVQQGHVPKDEAGLKELDVHLQSRTFLVSNHLTAADVALFAAIQPIAAGLPASTLYKVPSLTRYLLHLQSTPPVSTHAPTLSPNPLKPVELNLDAMPKTARADPAAAAEAKKKEKQAKAAAAAAAAAASGAASGPASGAAASSAPAAPADGGDGKQTPSETPNEGKQGKKKEKKEKKAGGGAGGGGKEKEGKGGNGAANEPFVPLPSMIDLRVGLITSVKRHPDADSLYVETIDIGEETGPRTVVSGLVKYMTPDQLQDRLIITVCNLKPASMRGVKSFAMVLCATSRDGKDGGVEFVDPPAGSKPGDRVYFEGFEDKQAEGQLNPKKKVFETIQPGFTTTEAKEAAWVEGTGEEKKVHLIRTEKGVCTVKNFVGASLS